MDVSSSKHDLEYQWRLNDLKVGEDTMGHTMYIKNFETKHAGTYECVVSSKSEPKMSLVVEAKVELCG